MNARRVVVCSSFLRKQGSSVFASLRSAGLPPAAGNFLCWHKESHQRNAFSKLKAQPVDSTTRGFSDSPFPAAPEKSCPRLRRGRSSVRAPVARKQHLLTLARSENAVHPCTAPFGSLGLCRAHRFSKQRAKRSGMRSCRPLTS